MPFHAILKEIRSQRPLIHCISNIVSANDCANLLLAVGASPMMAQAPEEMEEITDISRVTVLNTGTPDAERFRACEICGRRANAMHQPLVLDPVGVGASRWRLAEVNRLLRSFTPSLIRVNLGEALALLGNAGLEYGVDSTAPCNPNEAARCATELAQKLHCAVLLTGATDIAADGRELNCIGGGSGRMAGVTGSGCMLSALCGAFLTATESTLQAAIAASEFWKKCGAVAEENCIGRGNGAYRSALIDAASRIGL